MRLWRWGVVALAAGCATGQADGDGATGETASTGTTTSATTPCSATTDGCCYPATWAGVQDFFTVYCDACHLTSSGAGELDLRAAVEEDVAAGGGSVVVPGIAEGSSLWRDVAGESALWMPPDDLLPIEQICHVRAWIDAGASLE